ncbi:MAG: cysteine desulfurase family protein [Alphaproteobacteria bacterium]
MTRRGCYLDYNAGAPLKPAVVAAMAEARERPGNPSSVHRFGRLARRAVEDARALVAALVGAAPAEVVFTGSGTEANNLALTGCRRRRLIVSAIEHDSVLRAAPGATRAPVDGDGVVDLAALAATLASEDTPALVSVMLANNETGVVQPAAEVAALARAHGALFHCDAVQAAGKIRVDVAALGADLVSLSAHKLGGPQGVGALVVRDGVDLESLLHGGRQEMGRRAGTENVAGIVGFGVACALAADDLAAAGRLAGLRDEVERRLTAVAPEAGVFGASAERLPNTSCLAMPGVASETQVMALDLAGVAVSAGAACSSGKVSVSHVLRAMGVEEDEAGSAIRVSLGWASTAEDVERLVEAWCALYARTRAKAARPDAPSPAA